jgi:hypothetical protein
MSFSTKSEGGMALTGDPDVSVIVNGKKELSPKVLKLAAEICELNLLETADLCEALKVPAVVSPLSAIVARCSLQACGWGVRVGVLRGCVGCRCGVAWRGVAWRVGVAWRGAACASLTTCAARGGCSRSWA